VEARRGAGARAQSGISKTGRTTLTSGVDAGVILSLVGVAGGPKIVHEDVFTTDVTMLCLDDLLGEFRDGKLSVFVHSARLRPMFCPCGNGTFYFRIRRGRAAANANAPLTNVTRRLTTDRAVASGTREMARRSGVGRGNNTAVPVTCRRVLAAADVCRPARARASSSAIKTAAVAFSNFSDYFVRSPVHERSMEKRTKRNSKTCRERIIPLFGYRKVFSPKRPFEFCVSDEKHTALAGRQIVPRPDNGARARVRFVRPDDAVSLRETNVLRPPKFPTYSRQVSTVTRISKR